MQRLFSYLAGLRAHVSSISQLIVRYRAITFVVCMAITTVAVLGIRQLKFLGDNRTLIQADTDVFRDFEVLREDFGTHKNDVTVLLECEDVFDRDVLNAIHSIHTQVTELETVEDALSIFSIRKRRRVASYIPPILHPQLSDEKIARAREQILQHPLAVGQFVCDQGKAAVVIIRLAGDYLTTKHIAGVDEDIRRIANSATAELNATVTVSGLPRLRLEIAKGVKRDLYYIGIIALGIASIVACFLFRRPVVIFIVCFAPLVGAIWTLGYMGHVGEHLHVLNVIVPVMVLLIGFTDSVHLMFHVRREREEGATPVRASMSALKQVGPACVLASLTNAIGFGALMMAEDRLLQQFGLTSAIGSLLAMAAVLTLVPVLTSTRLGLSCVLTGPSHHSAWEARLGESWAGWLLRYPTGIALCGITITVAMAFGAFNLKADFRFTESLPQTNAALQGLQRCDAALGGLTPINVMVQLPENARLKDPQIYEVLADVHQAVEDQEGMSYPVSLLTLLESLPGRSPRPASRLREMLYLPKPKRDKFLNAEKRHLRVIARVKDLPASELLPICEQLQVRLDEIAAANPGYRLRASGISVVSAHRIKNVITDLTYSLATAAALIVILMTASFRSVKLGLISVIPNVFPLLATAALLYALGEPLRYTGVVCFCISLGLAVDDTIHFLWRYRRELKRSGDNRSAIANTCFAITPVLIVTTVFMLIAFGSAVFAQVPTLRVFGLTTCAALSLALVGDLVLLPAVLAANWHPFGLGIGRSKRAASLTNAITPSPEPSANQ